MTKKIFKEYNWTDLYNVKVKNLPVLVCKQDPDHRFIKTRKRQASCLFCLWKKAYPKPLPVNYFEELDEEIYAADKLLREYGIE